MFTKSGIMVGLGEERNEVLQLMDDLRAADVDFLTIGQYLQPTRKHHEVVRFVHARRVQGLRDHRLRQGLPDGLGLAADALLASCGRRFRAAQGRAGRTTRLMPQFRTKRRVRHAAAEMFDLVADIERYPEFVPLCQSMRIRKRTDTGEGMETVVAEMTVAYKVIRETFTSRVTLDRPNLEILVEYLDGPFSRMENRWDFHPVAIISATSSSSSPTNSRAACSRC